MNILSKNQIRYISIIAKNAFHKLEIRKNFVVMIRIISRGSYPTYAYFIQLKVLPTEAHFFFSPESRRENVDLYFSNTMGI